MDENRDDTFLARWLNNDLTEEERKEFEASDEFKHYRKIVLASENIMPEEYDTENMLSNIKSKKHPVIAPPGRSGGRVIRLWGYSVAAAVTLLVGFFYFYQKDTRLTTGFGEQTAVALPDGSEMMLNAKSEAVYNARSWQEDRKIDLAGEAFFKVAKGNTFTVHTDRGDITVLGTEFNVRSMDDLLMVTCYEGKVKVLTGKGKHTLLPGDDFRSLNGEESVLTIQDPVPGWTKNESSFKSMPVKYVLFALEDQFNIDLQYSQLPSGQLYTGSFPHGDMKVALDIVLGALRIEYEIKNERTVLLKD